MVPCERVLAFCKLYRHMWDMSKLFVQGLTVRFLTFLNVSGATHVTAHNACMTTLNKFEILQHSSHRSTPFSQKIVSSRIKTSVRTLTEASLPFHQAKRLHNNMTFHKKITRMSPDNGRQRGKESRFW